MSTRTWRATDYYELLGVEPGAAPRRSRARSGPQRRTTTPTAPTTQRPGTVHRVVRGLRRARQPRATRPLRRAAALAPTPEPGAARPAPARVPNRAEPVVPVPRRDRPLSVRALPERRHARWASIGGVVLLVAGIAAAGTRCRARGSGPGVTENGSDPTGRLLTLGLVALKLVVVGIVFVRAREPATSSPLTPVLHDPAPRPEPVACSGPAEDLRP